MIDQEAALARARPWLEEATRGTLHTLDGVEKSIREGQYQLWLTDQCCVVTEMTDWRVGARTIQALWAGGDLDAIVALLPTIEAWARTMNCSEFLVESRAGWQRVLNKHGFKPWSVTVRKAL